MHESRSTPPLIDRYSLASLLMYFALSVFFFGRSLAGHLSNAHLGTGPDPSVMIWMLVWWSHAIAHRLNVFMTRAIWAPSGFNLAWAATITEFRESNGDIEVLPCESYERDALSALLSAYNTDFCKAW